MVNEINELSRMLGRLEEGVLVLRAEAEVGRAQRAEITMRLSNIESINLRIAELEKRADGLDDTLSIHEQWRQRGIGMMILVSATVSLLGGALTVLLSWMRGH